MSVLVVGTTALDSIKTPTAENPRLLGGSASHAAVAASFFAPVKLVGGVGEDFPAKYISLYQRHRIDLAGLQTLPGKTFHWSGEYEANMNNRRTLATELGVIETFSPTLPKTYQSVPFVLLGNIAPALQNHVLNQMTRARFVVADTMDLWLNIALPDLLKLIKRLDGFVLNDSEAHQLTKADNVFNALKKIHALRTQIRHHQERFARFHFIRPKRLFHLPCVPLVQSGGPDGRRRLICRRINGISGRRQGPDRRQYPPRDGLWQRSRILLLRRFRPDPHHQSPARRHRKTRQRAGKIDPVLSSSPDKFRREHRAEVVLGQKFTKPGDAAFLILSRGDIECATRNSRGENPRRIPPGSR